MKLNRVAAFFICALLGFGICVESAGSRISAAMVYPSGAMITRTITTEFSKGAGKVTFDSLPENLEEASVRAWVGGEEQIRITGIEFKKQILQQTPDESIRQLQLQIRTIGDEIEDLNSQAGVLKSESAFLDSLRVSYAERTSKDLSMNPPDGVHLSGVFDFLAQSLSRVAKENRKIAVQKREAEEKSKLLQEQLQMVQSKVVGETNSAEVRFAAEKEGRGDIFLSYVMPNAGWFPIYDARLSADGKTVDLHYNAMVTQQTGEDWTDIALSLSTARARVNANPPTLMSWKIAIQKPQPGVDSDRYNVAGSESGQQTSFLARGTGVNSDRYNVAQVEMQQTSALFKIPTAATIPSDGSPHSTSITLLRFPSDTEYLVIPKISSDAFLRSEFRNDSGLPLLPGEISIFLGGNYSGTSTMPNTAPSQNFRLYFGVDDAIRVKRNEITKKDDAGIFKGNQKDYEYEIKVDNFKTTPQRITVIDQLPVSDNADLKVKLEDINPNPVEHNPDGMVKWILDVNPKETKEIRFKFTVESPKDTTVVGLR